jgi:hypothetical protein
MREFYVDKEQFIFVRERELKNFGKWVFIGLIPTGRNYLNLLTEQVMPYGIRLGNLRNKGGCFARRAAQGDIFKCLK